MKKNLKQKGQLLTMPFLGIFLLFLAFNAYNNGALAEFNPQISYQGRLTDSAGDPLSGDYNFRFRICNNSNCDVVYWTEERVGVNKVTISDGSFSLMLGEIQTLEGFDFNRTLYFEVGVGGTGDTPSWDVLLPRRVIGSVASAFNAEKINGLAVSSLAVLDRHNEFTNTNLFVATTTFMSNVGIGTSTPEQKLTVLGDSYFYGTYNDGSYDYLNTIRTNYSFTETEGVLAGYPIIANLYSYNTSTAPWALASIGHYIKVNNSPENVGIMSQGLGFAYGAVLTSEVGYGAYIKSVSGTAAYIVSTNSVGANINSTSGTGADISSVSGTGADISSDSGIGAKIYSSNYRGADIRSDMGVGAFIASNATTGLSVYSDAGTGALIRTHSGDYALSVINENSNKYAIYSSSGLNYFAGTSNFMSNVGIGTTTPQEKLVIADGSINSLYKYSSSSYDYSTEFKTNHVFYDSDFSGYYNAAVYAYATSTEDFESYKSVGLIAKGKTVGLNSFGEIAGGSFKANTFGIISRVLATGTAGIFRTDGDKSMGIKLLLQGDNSTGLSIGGTGKNKTAIEIDSDDLKYGLKITNSSTTSHSIYSDGGINYFSGRIGIGTTTPTQSLDVNGKIAINGNQTIYNANALTAYIGSLFVGNGGNSLSGTGIEGTGNTGIGINSLLNNTTGNRNTALGHNSLKNNISGFSNIAIGYQTLYNSTSSHSNLAIGDSALKSNTSGIYNVGVGYASLGFNNSGSFNNAFGNGALGTNSSGKFNTAIGSSALLNNTSGYYNTALGYLAGRYSVGSSTLFLGAHADTVSAGSSFYNASAIGYNAKVGGSNMMVLGGTGIDSVKVGIGTSTPKANLHVFQDYNGVTSIDIYNPNVGNTAYGALSISNGISRNDSVLLRVLGTGYSTPIGGEAFMADGGVLSTETNLSNGLSIVARNSSADIRFYAGGPAAENQRMIIKNDGNIGIGTSYPITKLEVKGEGYNDSRINVRSNTDNPAIMTLMADSDNVTAESNRFIFGKWGNGGWSSRQAFITNVGNSSLNFYQITNIGDHNPDPNGDNSHLVSLSINSNRNIGIGTTTPTERLVVNGNAVITGDGYATSFVETSDLLLKTNIDNLNYGLNEILNLRPVSFDYLSTGRPSFGFIAQEVKDIIPEVVYGKEGGYGLNYSIITALLVKGVQEQQQQINLLSSNLDLNVADSVSEDIVKLPVAESDPQFNTLRVTGATEFYGTITVIGEAGFISKVTFEKDVEIKGKLYVSSDQAGTTKIIAGETTIEVKFSGEYESIPKVVANLVDDEDETTFVNWKIIRKSVNGFTIVLQQAVNKDLEFDWIALSVKEQNVAEIIDSGSDAREVGAETQPEEQQNEDEVITEEVIETESSGESEVIPEEPIEESVGEVIEEETQSEVEPEVLPETHAETGMETPVESNEE
jgi:trimeric autotransporter adhesin